MISRLNRRRLITLAKKIILKPNGCGKSGVSCVFHKISEHFGVKYTTNRDSEYARRIFAAQRRAWRLGLGPYCFGLFSFVKGTSRIWGFITQIADILSDIVHEGRYKKEWFADGGRMFPESWSGELKKHANRLMRILKKKIGSGDQDQHWYNIGRIGKVWVCIDFGND